jgi:hypothetical protein
MVGYSVNETFGVIFRYFSDHWDGLTPQVKASLQALNMVPVGHMLIRSTRLFFRLTEDLSPFMHEVPRVFGVHESFLKKLGVKESPSAEDYGKFLKDLAGECHDQSLNTNELRAVTAIIASISNEYKALPIAIQQQLNPLFYLPDENGILRHHTLCLVNDDMWLRGRAGSNIERHASLYITHPSISIDTARQLGRSIPTLSTPLDTPCCLHSSRLTSRSPPSLSSPSPPPPPSPP